MRYRTALLFLTLLAFGLRVYDLGRQSFWLDEVDAIAMAGEPIATHLRKLSAIGENGPLYFLLFKGWIALAGTSEVGARFLSVVASTAAVPLLYALALRLSQRVEVALCAGLLATCSPYYVWYGQDAKMYPLYAVLALGAQYAFLRGWDQGRVRRAWWTGYVVCSSLALYVHIFAVLQIAANTVAGAVLWVWRRSGRRGFAIATAALVGPYVPLAAWQAPVLLRGANVGYAPATLQVIVVALLEQLTWHLQQPVDRRLLLVLSLIALFGAARLVRASETKQRRNGASALALLSCWLIVPVAVLLAIQGRVPVFRDRYMIPLLAPLIVLLAMAAAPMRRTSAVARALGAAAAAFLGGSFGYGLAHRPPNPDFRAAAELVHALATPQDQVGFLAEYAGRPFEFYYRKAPGQYVKVTLPYTNYPALDEREGLLRVASGLRGGRWIWIVRFEDWLWDSRDLAGQYMANRGAHLVLQRDFNGVSVTRYEMPG